MATAKSIAVRTDAAIRRIEEIIATLSEQAGTPPADLRPQGRTAELARAAQLEAIADALAAIAQAGRPAVPTTAEPAGLVDTEPYPPPKARRR